jgi:hypothetical protein
MTTRDEARRTFDGCHVGHAWTSLTEFTTL